MENQAEKSESKKFCLLFRKIESIKVFYRKKIEMLFENHNSYFSM